MDSLAIAMVVIFILHLLDKHNVWRSFFKGLGWVALICVIGAGGYYGWESWQENRAAKRDAEVVPTSMQMNMDQPTQTATDARGFTVENAKVAPAQTATKVPSDDPDSIGKSNPLAGLGVPAIPRNKK